MASTHHQSKSTQQPFTQRSVCVVGVPLCHGQTRQGVRRTPAVLRESGLKRVIENLGWKVTDVGDLQFRRNNNGEAAAACTCSLSQLPSVRRLHSDEYAEDEVINSKLLGEACGQTADAVAAAARQGEFVLALGGDHSLAAGSVAGMLTVHPDLVVIWVDAHSDINVPESSPSKSYHGMPVAHLLGLFNKRLPGFEWMSHVPELHPQNFAFIGLRDIDPYERQSINRLKMEAFSMKDIDHNGIATVMKLALHRIDPSNKRPIHLSFDIDGCDPSIAPGTGTTARGGLSYREAHYICEILHETGRVVSMDLVEINPDLDKPDEVHHGDDVLISEDATRTVRLGLELVSSVLGKSIL